MLKTRYEMMMKTVKHYHDHLNGDVPLDTMIKGKHVKVLKGLEE